MNCIYIKFTQKTVLTIERWYFLLDNMELYNKYCVYIWIYTYPNMLDNLSFIEELKQKYSKCIFVSNLNITEYLDNNEMNSIDRISSGLGFHNETGKSHLTCYYLARKYKYDFLINLDGDDMFYPGFQINYFDKAISYMSDNNLKFITRPFWICYNTCFKSSFGFSISSLDILDYLDIENNKHKVPNGNLDQLFSDILTNVKKHTYNEIHFGFADYPWNKGETIEPLLLCSRYNAQVTRNMIEMKYILDNRCHIVP